MKRARDINGKFVKKDDPSAVRSFVTKTELYTMYKDYVNNTNWKDLELEKVKHKFNISLAFNIIMGLIILAWIIIKMG